MSNDRKESFQYTYSAKQQEEVRRIREKYTPPAEEDKMTQLRRLDAGVTKKGTAASLFLGLLSALIFGVGMCLCLVWAQYLSGVIVGVIGIAGMALAHPLYDAVTKRERRRLTPLILQLTDELMQ